MNLQYDTYLGLIGLLLVAIAGLRARHQYHGAALLLGATLYLGGRILYIIPALRVSETTNLRKLLFTLGFLLITSAMVRLWQTGKQSAPRTEPDYQNPN